VIDPGVIWGPSLGAKQNAQRVVRMQDMIGGKLTIEMG